uniref:Seizure related 6 homolog n=1 Tax=Bubo bubo TaxID=30461 RepID=A0A8C0ESR0_BUBBB
SPEPHTGAAVVPGDEEGTTTTSTITTTTVTTLQGPVPCNRTLAGPEGWLVSPEPAGVPYDGSLDCTYTVSVYPGYGVELKVSWGLQVGWGAQCPYAREPLCLAACGGVVRNATVGRIVSPGFPGNYSNNLTCHWLLEAPTGHRLHLHFEKVSLAEDDDRLIIRNGNNVETPPVYDSYEVEYLPIEGLLSTGRHFFVELTTDSSGAAAGMALRYEAFEQGHCYEPFVKYGNFTASDPRYPVGTTVEFTCDPGYTLEQGSTIIECVDPSDPQWNETEPACRGGVLSTVGKLPEVRLQAGCWGDARAVTPGRAPQVQNISLAEGETLTVESTGGLEPTLLANESFLLRGQVIRSPANLLTLRFQSPRPPSPGSYRFHYQGMGQCPPPARTPWYPLKGSPTSTVLIWSVVMHCGVYLCHWQVKRAPTRGRMLMEMTSCRDPGDAEHSRRVVSSPKFPVGATVQYVCDKGYVLAGAGTLTCHDRTVGGPKWSDRLPKCIRELGTPLPRNTTQTSDGLGCRGADGHPGVQLVWGDPSVSQLSWTAVAKAVPSGTALEGTNVAIAIFLPVLVVALLIGGIYLYFSKLQGKPGLQLPLAGSHPYDHITVESAFDNPTYETGETREYEVSI